LEPLSNFFQELQKMRETPEIIDVEELDAMVAAAPPPPPAPRRDYGAALEAEYRDLGRLLEETPRAAALSAPSRREAPAEGIGEAVFADRQALRLGRAFHEAMERIDLGADSPFCGSDPMVTVTQGVNLGESRMLQEMVQNCMESTLLLRARKALAAGGKVLREVPYVRSLSREKGIEEGKIDLLFEEPDGWILVDYKTDMIDMDSRDYETYCQRKYGTQIGQYSSALSDAGVRVKKTYVLLARYGREVEVITG
jgi:hypothetical protein